MIKKHSPQSFLWDWMEYVSRSHPLPMWSVVRAILVETCVSWHVLSHFSSVDCGPSNFCALPGVYSIRSARPGKIHGSYLSRNTVLFANDLIIWKTKDERKVDWSVEFLKGEKKTEQWILD